MKKFVAIFLGSAAGEKRKAWDAMDEKARQSKQQEGGKAWHNWIEKNQKSIVELGSPLGKTKKVSGKGVETITNLMTAFTVVQAETHDEAAKLFLNHPHFSIFPGDSIEIMECLPIPGQ